MHVIEVPEWHSRQETPAKRGALGISIHRQHDPRRSAVFGFESFHVRLASASCSMHPGYLRMVVLLNSASPDVPRNLVEMPEVGSMGIVSFHSQRPLPYLSSLSH